MLVNKGVVIGRTHLRMLKRRMGVEVCYRGPRASEPASVYRIYPYLLRDAAVARLNQVWGTGIACTPLARGVVDLVVILGWFSRYALSWRGSINH